MTTDNVLGRRGLARRTRTNLGGALVAVAGATTLIVAGPTKAAGSSPLPPIDEIGAQYVTETGATSVACSQTPDLIICYGLLDGAVIAGTYADGVFTPFVSPTVAATSEPTGTGAAATTPTPADGSESDVPPEYINALRKAEDYLDVLPFSQSGLVAQLEFDQFSTEAAEWAVQNVDADWNEQAALKAGSYLDVMSFSEGGLRDQLDFDGFTPEQIDFAIAEMQAQGRL